MINWGIIGFGRMGKEYLECFKQKNSKLHLKAIASKSKKNTSLKNDNINFFQLYNDLLISDSIDAIYISTLNNTHKELVINAINNNKKILCEKPLGLNYEEVKELDMKLRNKVNFFNEAIAYRAHPQTIALLELLKSKEMGKIKKIESNFGFKVRKIKKDSRLFNKDLGGGAILDLGCYPISFFSLFNKSQEMKIIKSNYNICETDVDIDGTISLKLNDEIDAYGKVSLRENLKNICKIYCENGVITVPEPWLPSKKTFIEVETKNRYFKKIIATTKSVYEHQLEASTKFFLNETLEPNLLIGIKQSLEISKIIDFWRNNRN
tara:strand:+ start:317 stop:1282 length:966 start_codon:yes stop_codon:yes gene_type:complete